MNKFSKFYHRLRGETKHTLVFECPCCEDRTAIDVWAKRGETPKEALDRVIKRKIKQKVFIHRIKLLFGLKSELEEI